MEKAFAQDTVSFQADKYEMKPEAEKVLKQAFINLLLASTLESVNKEAQPVGKELQAIAIGFKYYPEQATELLKQTNTQVFEQAATMGNTTEILGNDLLNKLQTTQTEDFITFMQELAPHIQDFEAQTNLNNALEAWKQEIKPEENGIGSFFKKL